MKPTSVAILILIALYVYWVILDAFLFKKAGEKPFKAIIPIYGLIKKVRILSYDWYITLLGIMLPAMGVLGNFAEKSFSAGVDYSELQHSPLMLVLSIVAYGGLFIYNLGLAKKFGKSTLYGIGLFFAGLIFKSILAFSKAEYVNKEKIDEKNLIGWRCECNTMNPGHCDICSKCGKKKPVENG